MSITLRKKPLSDGRQSLYLDHYGEEGRRKEFLKLYRFKRPKDALEKEHNRETQKLAESIVSKRVMQNNSAEHGFTLPRPAHGQQLVRALRLDPYHQVPPHGGEYETAGREPAGI